MRRTRFFTYFDEKLRKTHQNPAIFGKIEKISQFLTPLRGGQVGGWLQMERPAVTDGTSTDGSYVGGVPSVTTDGSPEKGGSPPPSPPPLHPCIRAHLRIYSLLNIVLNLQRHLYSVKR